MGEGSHCPAAPSGTLLLFFHLQIRVQSDPGARGPQIRVGRVAEVPRCSPVLQVGHPHPHHSPELSTQGSLPSCPVMPSKSCSATSPEVPCLSRLALPMLPWGQGQNPRGCAGQVFAFSLEMIHAGLGRGD